MSTLGDAVESTPALANNNGMWVANNKPCYDGASN